MSHGLLQVQEKDTKSRKHGAAPGWYWNDKESTTKSGSPAMLPTTKSSGGKRTMPYITHVFTSNQELKVAVDEYLVNPSSFNYRIGLCDVCQITDFSRESFMQEGISPWNALTKICRSGMRTMQRIWHPCLRAALLSTAMFLVGMCRTREFWAGCTSFRGNVSPWDVSTVTALNRMFDSMQLVQRWCFHLECVKCDEFHLHVLRMWFFQSGCFGLERVQYQWFESYVLRIRMLQRRTPFVLGRIGWYHVEHVCRSLDLYFLK